MFNTCFRAEFNSAVHRQCAWALLHHCKFGSSHKWNVRKTKDMQNGSYRKLHNCVPQTDTLNKFNHLMHE